MYNFSIVSSLHVGFSELITLNGQVRELMLYFCLLVIMWF